jgi:Phospholipase_D-nuclease N-terminal
LSGIKRRERMVAYVNNPSFWDVVWWMFIFFVWVMWIFVVINVFLDNFRRHDHSGFAKAMWTVLIVFLPVIGVCAYLLARPRDVATA